MSLEEQVSALAERIGQEFQQRACPGCFGCQAWFCQPPVLMMAVPLVCLALWSAWWRESS